MRHPRPFLFFLPGFLFGLALLFIPRLHMRAWFAAVADGSARQWCAHDDCLCVSKRRGEVRGDEGSPFSNILFQYEYRRLMRRGPVVM